MVANHIYDFGCSTFTKGIDTNGNYPIFADKIVYFFFIISEIFPISLSKPKSISGDTKPIISSF